MTRPARSFTAETPVSRTATLIPAPRLPAWNALPACELQTYVDADVVSSQLTLLTWPERSAVTAVTPGSRDSSPSRSAGTTAETPSMIGRGARAVPPTRCTAARTADMAPCDPETTTRCSAEPVADRPGSRTPGRAGVALTVGATANELPASAAARARAPRRALRGVATLRVQALDCNVAERDCGLINYLP